MAQNLPIGGSVYWFPRSTLVSYHETPSRQ